MTGLKAKTLMGAMIVLLCMHCSFGQATTQPAKVPMTGGTILSAVPADAWVGTVFNDLNKSGRMIDSYAVRLGMQAPVRWRCPSRWRWWRCGKICMAMSLWR